jgi:hypothetical protein
MDELERKSPLKHIESAADEAMKALTQLFSSGELSAKVHFHSGLDSPTVFDMFFESMRDDLFGPDPNSDYKCWVKRLYRLGLISAMPSEWKVAKDAENSQSEPGS